MLGFVTGLAAEARLLEALPALTAVGGGMPSGAAEAAAALARRGVSGLISFGLAGGLDPALPCGTVIIPRMIHENGRTFICDPRLIERLGGATHQMMAAGETIIGSTAEKSALFAATGAVAVDLESGAVARIAALHHLPFAVLRAVADPAWRALPEAAVLGLDPSGRIALGRIMLSLSRKPSQLPGLLALGRDARAAKASLARRVRMLAEAA